MKVLDAKRFRALEPESSGLRWLVVVFRDSVMLLLMALAEPC